MLFVSVLIILLASHTNYYNKENGCGNDSVFTLFVSHA